MKIMGAMKEQLALMPVSGFFAQDQGLQAAAQNSLGSQAAVGKQYALFIAIDGYSKWPPLKKPAADAREIRDILKDQYYIDEFIELYNKDATKANIIKTFAALQGKLGVDDSLFIYYAGHGHLDEASNAGFWMPVDAGTDVYAQENWLPNSQVGGYVSRLKALHVFMVSDAFFSGDMLNTARALPEAIDSACYRKAYPLASRQVLASGSSETAPDGSFSQAIKICLRKNAQPLLDPLGIYNEVRLSARSTAPLYGALNQAGHQEGAAFLFFRRNAANPGKAEAATPPAPAGMVWINGGTFTMGSPASEADREPWDKGSEAQHQVTISKGFWMGKYEVTQEEWAAVMGGNPSYFKGDSLPVEQVSWFDAIEYCNKRSAKEGLAPAYTAIGSTVTRNEGAGGYRLPTEAEWEYACRAGTTTPFSTGGNITTGQANYDGNYPYNGNAKGTYLQKTWAVGSGAANGWGLYDMHGNVWEWCWDWYGSYSGGSQTDPGGAVSGDGRVLRGGGWYDLAQFLRSALRCGGAPAGGDLSHGFRLVRP